MVPLEQFVCFFLFDGLGADLLLHAVDAVSGVVELQEERLLLLRREHDVYDGFEVPFGAEVFHHRVVPGSVGLGDFRRLVEQLLVCVGFRERGVVDIIHRFCEQDLEQFLVLRREACC